MKHKQIIRERQFSRGHDHRVSRVDELSAEQKAELAIRLMERAGGEIFKLAIAIRASTARPFGETADDGKFKRAMEALEHITTLFDIPPDEEWNRDYLLLTGQHSVLTEEGWCPAECNTREHTGEEPCEVFDEVNAPVMVPMNA